MWVRNNTLLVNMPTTVVTRRRKGGKNNKNKSNSAESVGRYAGDAWSLAKRTAYGLNEIRKLINVEEKYIPHWYTPTQIDTTGIMYSLSMVGQGLTSTTRVGDSIRIQHLEIRGSVLVNSADATCNVRVMVVRDLDGYGTAPTPADVLETTQSVAAPFSPVRFSRRSRFSVLYDELFALQGASAGGTASQVFSYSSAHQGHVLYLGTTAQAASDGKGSVYVLAVSDETDNKPYLSFYANLLFTDD